MDPSRTVRPWRLVALLSLALACLGPGTTAFAVPSSKEARSAEVFCQRQLRAARDRGQPYWVVSDMDKTLVDPSRRDQQAWRSWLWQRTQGQPWPVRLRALLSRLRPTEIGWTGRQTALNKGLSAAAAEDYQRHWDRYFWDPAHWIRDDRPIAATWSLVKQALADPNARLVVLTGRTNQLGTERQLARLLARYRLPGLDSGRVEVRCKPEGSLGPGTTDRFKAAELARLRRLGPIALYFDDTPPPGLKNGRAVGKGRDRQDPLPFVDPASLVPRPGRARP